jgi:hypothetical protein
MFRYRVDSPRQYRRFSLLLLCYLLRWFLIEGGHKIGHRLLRDAVSSHYRRATGRTDS